MLAVALATAREVESEHCHAQGKETRQLGQNLDSRRGISVHVDDHWYLGRFALYRLPVRALEVKSALRAQSEVGASEFLAKEGEGGWAQMLLPVLGPRRSDLFEFIEFVGAGTLCLVVQKPARCLPDDRIDKFLVASLGHLDVRSKRPFLGLWLILLLLMILAEAGGLAVERPLPRGQVRLVLGVINVQQARQSLGLLDFLFLYSDSLLRFPSFALFLYFP